LKFARKISQTAPMSACVKSEIAPGPDVCSDEQMTAYCREAGLSLLHAVGTCKMGIGADAVVDPRLRVIGIADLRVIDASIMPRIVTGNTNAAAIMIGEKGAALVLEDARH
jgi:choline dehydrogenase